MSKRRRIFGSSDLVEQQDKKNDGTDATLFESTTSSQTLLAAKDASIANQAALIASQRQYIHDILSNISQLDGFSKAHAAIAEARLQELRQRAEALEKKNEALRKEREREGEGEVGKMRERVQELEGELQRLKGVLARMDEATQMQHGELVCRGQRGRE